MLVVAQLLVAKAQHEMGEPGGADRVAIRRGERPADVDAADVGAAAGVRERGDGHAHRPTPQLPELLHQNR